MKRYIILSILGLGLTLFVSFGLNAQVANCAGADPFCTGTTYAFPMATGVSPESGPNYGCLYSQPNPVWYYLKIATPGDITIYMQSPSGNDIDFACWGPYTSPTGACTAGLTATCTGCTSNDAGGVYPQGNLIDCCYCTAAVETCHISNALVGQYYLLCITNYANSPGNITFSQSNTGQPGAGSTDCSIMTPCNISAATATPGACNPLTNQYSVSGTITFTNAPSSGTLVITDNAGATQTLNMPFTSPMSFNLTGLNSNGASHTVHIAFSSDPYCVFDVTYTAPAPCNACIAEAGPDQTICGLSTTMAAVILAGDYNYAWTYTGGVPGVVASNPNSPTSIVTVPYGGSYNFTWTVTNANGVTCSDVVNIKFSAIPTSTFNFTNIQCFDNNTSTLTFTGAAGSTAIYNWNFAGGTAIPGGTSIGPQVVTWTTAGPHNVSLTVTESNCPSTVTTHIITSPTDLVTSVTTTPASCSGNNGTVIVNASGGASGYTYSFSNCTCPTAPTAAGIYDVTITDANGCYDIDPFTITQPQPLTVTQQHTNLLCYHDNSGTAGVSVTGGTPGYNIVWPGGATGPGVTGLAAGNYTVTITDANSCIVTITIAITEPTLVTANITNSTNITCNGVCNGGATVSSTGGTAPLTVNWGTSSNPIITTLCAGIATVTVTDANGCDTIVSVTITEPSPLTPVISNQANVTCYGGNNGSATVTAGGGVAPYEYYWCNGTVTQTINNRPAGVCCVTVTDFNGCTQTTCVTITQPAAVNALVNSTTDATCYGACDGTANVSGSGGTLPYSYFWWNGPQGTQNSVTILCAGTHTVTVTDANNCTTTTTINTSEPAEVVATITAIDSVSCFGGSDGSATVTASGGSPGYTYSWNTTPQQTSTTATGLSAINYSVIVTDANNCKDTTTVTIPQPVALTAAANILSDYNGYSISCFGLANGNVDLVVTGGTIPYSYLWSNGVITQDLSNIAAGTYTVLVTDLNNCTATTTAILTEPPELLVSIPSISNYTGFGISCNGLSDGNVNLTISGGTTPFTISWNNGAYTSQNLSNVPAGNYSVLVTDANSCTETADTVLIQPPQLVSLVTDTGVSCNGFTDGSADLTVTGGVQPYSYMWSNASTSQDLVNIPAGYYYVAITDINNCLITDSVSIYQPPPLTISTTPNQLICSGIPTPISVIPSGGTGTGTYTYYWNEMPGLQTWVVNPTLNTTYSVFVIDANNCISDTGHIIVNVLPPLTFNLYAETDSVCLGSSANISPMVSGGDGGPYSLYHNGIFINDFPYVVFPGLTTDYIIMARDGCGTTAYDTITIRVLPRPSVVFIADKYRGCRPFVVSFHEELNVEGSSYSWNFNDNGATLQSHYPVHTFESEGVYDITLTVTAQNGCNNAYTRPSMITVYPLPEARFTTDPELVSIIKPTVAFTNLSIDAVHSYWSFGDDDSSEIVNPTHTYNALGDYFIDLVVVTEHGCKDTSRQKIIVRDEYSFYAPSAFSPDKNGINDVFNVYGRGIDPGNFTMLIYDRWGELIFETHDLNEGWDGRYQRKAGTIENGVYSWMVIYTDLSRVVHHKAGAVTLIH
ncbi:MAG: gliding motility-associated C-terminal domain-containing protein [Bacteroidia bacterium]|nr:gliding motility-associated C-terminal domain-containing protein [Bacteroidia bacterium]